MTEAELKARIAAAQLREVEAYERTVDAHVTMLDAATAAYERGAEYYAGLYPPE